MARVPYLDREQVAPELHEVYDTIKKNVGRVGNFYRILAHFPKGLKGYLGLGAALRETKLDPKLRELAYLQTSRLNRCDY